ncbi:Protein GLUTAMINE DUMPER 2 [Zostera marina]|uniref:Protein GLUTAMINE DUMPER 2 n=1 Tax=Zostera marina TaxID=29655 RepID=A0A0K9PQI4_ZOSMR|nr:Protein GLUTAMINE DUMPER 2 [Zostera marina]
MRSTGVVHAPVQSQKQHYSTWSSPIPYLFGGLATILLVIFIALVSLACSYRRLMNRSIDEETHSNDVGGRENETRVTEDEEKKFVVIMAGYDKPTFLAIPTTSSRKE